MVASSSNLLLVASSHAGHVRMGSPIPNDHDPTLTNVFKNFRSATNRKVLAFDLSAPSMPDMLSMPAPALPTPAMNQNSKQKNEMSNSNNDNAASMKKQKKKKKNHMGRRLRQIKKRLTSSKSSPSKQIEEEVCLSQGTSATTSTLSFGQTSEEKGDDVPFMDEMDMMKMMTTTLKPRVRSMFSEELEDMLMMPMMPVLPAPPCPLSTATSPSPSSPDTIITSTPPPPSSFSSKLNKALSVLFLDDDDDDDDDAGNAVDDTDDWGIFASFDDEDDDDDEEHDMDDDVYNHPHVSKFSSSRSVVTKSNALYFPPRTHLPVVFAATTAGAE